MNINNMFDLSGKVAFVSGGATGIGRMATEAMAMAGARQSVEPRGAPADVERQQMWSARKCGAPASAARYHNLNSNLPYLPLKCFF